MGRKKNEVEVEEINEGVVAELDLNEIEQESESVIPAKAGEDGPLIPTMDELTWQDYIMKQFDDSEIINMNGKRHPKVDGLRRVVRKEIGKIVVGRGKVVEPPTLDNGQRATVEYTVIVEPFDGQTSIEFTDVADAWQGNIPNIDYARFPTALASTRAEGRALRKILNLSVAAAEEMSNQSPEESGFDNAITDQQITLLDFLCEKHNIDVLKFINIGKIKYKKIDDVTYLTAQKMFKQLNKYQTKTEEVPANIAGYDPNWKGD